MTNARRSWKSWGFVLVILLSVVTVAYAQLGGMGGGNPLVLEYTMQEVRTPLLARTMNDLSKALGDLRGRPGLDVQDRERRDGPSGPPHLI